MTGFSVPTACRFDLIRNASGFAFCLRLHKRHRCRRCDALPTAKTLYRALRIHIERVETMATSHEKTVSLAATEAKIRAPLGQRDAANPSVQPSGSKIIATSRSALPPFPNRPRYCPSMSQRKPSGVPKPASISTRLAPRWSPSITSNTRTLQYGTAQDSDDIKGASRRARNTVHSAPRRRRPR